ncbi:MAG TPA: hypothetical protein EYO51_08935 [Methylococcaceae bacterium]|jgi:hypothetical protein|nr:hypothetical protein [Methylococcaceae bacterium]HIA45148.1 hypothetical protein [Methylococcaceae bacterium]HIB63235.1 hypothetical protein [Methylococcaceae bacterium]HIN67668.1 hypothetical protein [Methylococcales bacterium]HIO44684.1 hypothetical protein [Methylococcales bacterium]
MSTKLRAIQYRKISNLGLRLFAKPYRAGLACLQQRSLAGLATAQLVQEVIPAPKVDKNRESEFLLGVF